MIWLYRLQQRLSMTRREGLAILTVTGLFLLGLGVRHIQKQQIPPLTVDSLVAHPPGDSLLSDSTEARDPSPPTPSAENPVNINTASQRALQALPGVGPVLAKRIDEYRSSQDQFEQVDELRNVSGIGPKTLSRLRSLVRVSPEPDTSE